MQCTSCGYELYNSKVCPSCGFDHRENKSNPVIYTPDRVESDAVATSDISNIPGYRDVLLALELHLDKWLWVLFWLIIPSTIGSVMVNFIPSLQLAGQIIVSLSAIAYGVILLKFTDITEHYRKAGIIGIITSGVSLFLSFIPVEKTILIFLTLPLSVIALVGQYHEFTGHSDFLAGIDNDLSDWWSKLWKWYVGMLCGIIGGTIIVFLIPIFGLLVVLVASIGLILVSIAKIVFLYSTAKLFTGLSTE